MAVLEFSVDGLAGNHDNHENREADQWLAIRAGTSIHIGNSVRQQVVGAALGRQRRPVLQLNRLSAQDSMHSF